ncbi:unnamed protein product, partial [Ectocarpus fasciculatus]
ATASTASSPTTETCAAPRGAASAAASGAPSSRQTWAPTTAASPRSVTLATRAPPPAPPRATWTVSKRYRFCCSRFSRCLPLCLVFIPSSCVT